MAVVSDLSFDARVWKEARSLAAVGYSVRMIGMAYETEHVSEWSEDGIEVMTIPFGSRRRITATRRVISLLRMWWRIIRTRASVYHCHNIHPGLAIWIAARFRRAPIVYDAHELFGHLRERGGVGAQAARRAGAFLERFMVRSSAGTIATNDARAAELTKRHGATGITVLENVPNRVDVLAPLDPGYPPDVPMLLYQGGIYARQRAFEPTVRALRLLKDVHLAIVGFGRDTELEAIKEWAGLHGVSGRVHVYGPRPFDQLVNTASAATIGIVPIRPYNMNTYLADTNKLFEYLMGGIPVVASDLPELRRVIAQGDPPVGAVFNPESANSIAEAVRIVLDPSTYQARSDEARRLALDHLNWEAQQSRLLELYGRLQHPGERR
jgi:glycosyltransferase involved in cell wall biosynthesis